MVNFPLVHKSFNAEDGNSSNSSSYHLLHGQLEWRWIYLTTLYKIECSRGTIGSESSDFKDELILMMYDLLTFSISKFHKRNNANFAVESPFICTCVKVLWTAFCEFINELNDPSLTFWNMFSSITNMMRDNKNPYEKFPRKRILLRSSSQVRCKNLEHFSIWLICGLAPLTSNNSDASMHHESFQLLESSVKKYLSDELSEESLRSLMLTLSEVLFDVWSPRSEILLALWETFQRRINSPFFIAGQSPSMMAVASISGAGLLEKIKKQQANTTKLNQNFTSYDMFVILVGKLVRRFSDDNQMIQNKKILNRIYAKFPATKLQSLNEVGIHNIIKLFITIAVSTNFKEIAKKVCDTLLQIEIDKINHQQQLMKGHMALLILHRENQMDISLYVTKLMEQVNRLTERSNSSVTSVLKIMADALPALLLQHSEEEAFENGEQLLLDSWIIKYLSTGTVAEQDRVFEAIIKLIQKLREAQSKSLQSSHLADVVRKLFSIILPHCKQTFSKSESCSLPAMVGFLCLLSSDQQTYSSDIPKFDVLFKTFIEMNCQNVENSVRFLTVVLENIADIKKQDKLTVMQRWIKNSVLLSGSNNILKELTRCVIKFEEFLLLSETARDQPDEFLNAKEPLLTFLTDVGRKFSTANDRTKIELSDKMNAYFSTFDKWALPILQLQQQQQSSSQRSQKNVNNDETVGRIYNFVSLAILHCSPIFYVRSKPSCFFNIAMSHFILPSNVMMGQNQPRSITFSIFRVWSLIIEGISKLDYINDPHVAKVLNDVVVKWAPQLKINTNSKVVSKPFLKVTDLKPEIVELVYGKLAKSFIALQNRKPNPHACMILTMFEEVMHVVESDESKLVLIWKHAALHLIEAAMMTDDNAPSQTTSYNLIERFMKNKHFDSSQQMKELMYSSLRAITQSHLSYHSVFFFK